METGIPLRSDTPSLPLELSQAGSKTVISVQKALEIFNQVKEGQPKEAKK